MAIEEFESKTEAIYWSNDYDFWEKVNRVLKKATLEMPFVVRETGPSGRTTIQRCSTVYYYTRKF